MTKQLDHRNHVTADLRELGDGVYLDVQKLIDSRLLVQGNSGGGKSYTVRKICEVTYGAAQQIVIDPDGEFHTLREKFDYALAGPEGECPATVESAAKLALTLLELGTSCVIDIYELGHKRAAFIARFLESLMLAPRSLWHDLIVVVDEASKFCTEGGKRDKATEESTNAIIDLMTRGRKRGFCGILATQRLSDLNKSAAAECNNALIGRCNLDVDIVRAALRIGMNRSQASEFLPELTAGAFYAMGPAIVNDRSPNRVALIQVGQVITTHPKRGQKVPVTPPRATVKKVLARLKEIPVEAQHEAKTNEELRATVQQLTADLARASKGVESHEVADLRTALEATTNSRNVNFKKLGEVTKERDDLRARALKIVDAYAGVPHSLRKIAEKMEAAVAPSVVDVIGRVLTKHNGAAHAPTSDGLFGEGLPAPNYKPKHGPVPHQRQRALSGADATDDADTGDRFQRLLDTMAMIEAHGLPSTREVIAAWYGRHPTDHGVRKYIAVLRSQGLVDGWTLTPAGRAAAHATTTLMPSEIYGRLMATLPPRVRRMMDAVLEAKHPLSRTELAEKLECHPTDHGFRKYLSTLRGRHLVTAKFPVTPTEVWKVS